MSYKTFARVFPLVAGLLLAAPDCLANWTLNLGYQNPRPATYGSISYTSVANGVSKPGSAGSTSMRSMMTMTTTRIPTPTKTTKTTLQSQSPATST